MYAESYTQKEINQIIFMRNQGKPWKEISKATGRSVSALGFKWNELKKNGVVEDLNVAGQKVGVTLASVVEKDLKTATVEPEPKPVQQTYTQTATMTPREMIKRLYDMGYRIEDNKLVCYQKVVVKINDILNES